MLSSRTKIKILSIIIACLFSILVSCDAEHGIAPKPIPEHEFGFGGNIVFYGAWPDSIKLMVLVVFKDRIITVDDIIFPNIRYLSFPIPLHVQSYQYTSLDSAIISIIPDDISPSEYNYFAVVQQSTEELSYDPKDWFVSGIYYVDGDTTRPGTLTIPNDSYVDNINIYCDFNNPPPQPPGGN